jgi:hypothetical protein
MELTSGRPVRTSSGAAGEGREARADQQWCSFDYVGGSADLLAGHTRRRMRGRYWGGDREQIRMHYTDRKPLHPVVQHTWAKGRTHARATEEAGSPVRVASYSRPFGTVSCEARADGDLAAARDTSGGRSAHRSISKRVWVVWEQGRPRGRVGSCETPP